MSLPTLFENPSFDSDTDATRPLLHQDTSLSTHSIDSDRSSIVSGEYCTVKSTLTSPAESDALNQADIYVDNNAASPISYDLENLSSGAFTTNSVRRNGSHRYSDFYFTDSHVPLNSSPQFTLGVELRTPSQPNTPHSPLNSTHFNPALHLAPRALAVVPQTRSGSPVIALPAPNNGCRVFMDAINQIGGGIEINTQINNINEMPGTDNTVIATSNQDLSESPRAAMDIVSGQLKVPTALGDNDSRLHNKGVIFAVNEPENYPKPSITQIDHFERPTIVVESEPKMLANSTKANRRLSTLSIANSLSAILTVVNESADFNRNESNSSLDEPRESESTLSSRENRKKNRKSWIRSHTRPQRISMLMEHAATTARAYTNGRATDHNMNDWTKDLESSLENLIVTRFPLDIPQETLMEPKPPKGIYRKTLARVSQYFTPVDGSTRTLYSLKSTNSSRSSILAKKLDPKFAASLPNVSLSSVQEDEFAQPDQSIEFSVYDCESVSGGKAPENEASEEDKTNEYDATTHISSPDSAEFCDARSTFEPVGKHYQLIPSVAIAHGSILSRKSQPSETVSTFGPNGSVESSVRSRRSLFHRRNPNKATESEKKMKKRYRLLAFFGYRSQVEAI